MAELPPDGTPLLGVPRRSSAPLNSFALWQYLLIFAVVLIGLTYAAPNVFQPDPAIQIRALDQRGEQGTANDAANQAVLARMQTLLREAGIALKGADLQGDSLILRVESDEAQLQAQEVATTALNANGLNYVVALASASTTPSVVTKPWRRAHEFGSGSFWRLALSAPGEYGRVPRAGGE